MFTKEQHQNFSMGELASLRQQVEKEEFQRKQFIEKMNKAYKQNPSKFEKRVYEKVEDYDDILF